MPEIHWSAHQTSRPAVAQVKLELSRPRSPGQILHLATTRGDRILGAMNGRVHSESEDSDEELPTECLPKECDDVGVTVDDLLFTACARGALAQVQALLADGACPARVDGLGRSARDVALFFGHRDCADAIMVSQLMAIFPEHHPRQLVAVAGRSSSVEEASERLLCADEEPLAASDGAGSSSDPPFSHRDHDHGPRTAATEALLASLHEILPSYDERLLADAALRCSSVEEATTWILDGMLDRGHSSAHGSASPHSALAAPPCPGSVVRLPSSEVRRLEERRNEIEEQKRRSRAEASQRALLEKEEAEQALEAELRTRVVLEELRAGRVRRRRRPLIGPPRSNTTAGDCPPLHDRGGCPALCFPLPLLPHGLSLCCHTGSLCCQPPPPPQRSCCLPVPSPPRRSP